MADGSQKLSITYSSGLIPPPQLMSTLTVFYDEVWLPYPGKIENGDFSIAVRLDFGQTGHAIRLTPKRKYELEKIIEQKRHWKILYDNGLLKNLPQPDTPSYRERNPESQSLDKASQNMRESIGDDNSITNIVLAYHQFLSYKPSPELFISDPSDTRTERLSGFLAQSIFQYHFPQLKFLNAEQILEVRHRLRNLKEGFRDDIFELTHEVEHLLLSGIKSEVIASEKIIERKYATKYREFQRQFESRNLNNWAKIGASIGTFLTVFLVPPSPALIGAILALYGGALVASSENWIRENSNPEQAFKYIATLKKIVGGKGNTPLQPRRSCGGDS